MQNLEKLKQFLNIQAMLRKYFSPPQDSYTEAVKLMDSIKFKWELSCSSTVFSSDKTRTAALS